MTEMLDDQTNRQGWCNKNCLPRGECYRTPMTCFSLNMTRNKTYFTRHWLLTKFYFVGIFKLDRRNLKYPADI